MATNPPESVMDTTESANVAPNFPPLGQVVDKSGKRSVSLAYWIKTLLWDDLKQFLLLLLLVWFKVIDFEF